MLALERFCYSSILVLHMFYYAFRCVRSICVFYLLLYLTFLFHVLNEVSFYFVWLSGLFIQLLLRFLFCFMILFDLSILDYVCLKFTTVLLNMCLNTARYSFFFEAPI